MLFSSLANINIVQSKKAEEYMRAKRPKYKIYRNQPIMWGVSKYLHNSNNFKQSKEYTILHASTCKKFGGRDWIYENSFEYLDNINFLIEKLSKIENVKLIIRFRQNIDNQYFLTKNLLNKSKNVEVKLSGNFYEDIMNSNLIISFSSTVIEESLYLKKPVALFGNDHYRHINYIKNNHYNKNNYPVYSLTRSNFDSTINKIISNDNFKLSNEGINDFCYLNNKDNQYENYLKKII